MIKYLGPRGYHLEWQTRAGETHIYRFVPGAEHSVTLAIYDAFKAGTLPEYDALLMIRAVQRVRGITLNVKAPQRSWLDWFCEWVWPTEDCQFGSDGK